MAFKIDCVGAYLSSFYTFPVKHHVVCLHEADRVLFLPHHELFFKSTQRDSKDVFVPMRIAVDMCLYFARSWATSRSREVDYWSVDVL